MGRKSKPKGKGLKPYLYRGVFRCGECGCFITTETQKGHNYLRCTKRLKPCSQPFVREEVMAGQIKDALASFGQALPPEWADWMIQELEREEHDDAQAVEQDVARVQGKIRDVEAKLARLMDAFVENVLSLEEFKSAKNNLIDQKKVLTDKLANFQKDRTARFEPLMRFLKGSKQASFLATGQNHAAQRDFFKTTGSNLHVENRSLRFEPRGAWQVVVNQGVLAQDKTPASLGRGGFSGEAHPLHMEAEREGFEPSVQLPVHTISSRVPSAARTPLQEPSQGALGPPVPWTCESTATYAASHAAGRHYTRPRRFGMAGYPMGADSSAWRSGGGNGPIQQRLGFAACCWWISRWVGVPWPWCGTSGGRPGGVKTGHAGTLDPMATGLVICCLGASATRTVPAADGADQGL